VQNTRPYASAGTQRPSEHRLNGGPSVVEAD
jgi:hypothetical protein